MRKGELQVLSQVRQFCLSQTHNLFFKCLTGLIKTKMFHYLKAIILVPKHVTAGTLKGKNPPW